MIVVTGASGTIGQAVVRQLTARGARFKVLVRDASKGEALGCDFVVGDFDDPATIAASFRGVEQVFLNVSVTESLVRRMIGAIDAAKGAGVAHVVKVSTIGADAASPLSIARWHGEVDAHLEQTRLRRSILQPCVFMQNILGQAEGIKQGRFYGAFGDGRAPFIDCEDIAACAVELLTTSRTGGPFALTGGASLTHAEVAEQLSTRLGKSVVYVDRPAEEVVNAMKARGMPSKLADDLGMMMGYIAKGGAPKPTSTWRTSPAARPGPSISSWTTTSAPLADRSPQGRGRGPPRRVVASTAGTPVYCTDLDRGRDGPRRGSGRPPHRSERAGLPRSAPALDSGVEPNVRTRMPRRSRSTRRRRSRGTRKQPSVVADFVGQARASAGAMRLTGSSVARERELQRACHVWLGLSPRVSLRIERVWAARAAIRAGGPLAMIAGDLGYADQAHLTREVRELLGVAPRELRPVGILQDLPTPSW